MFVSRLSVAVCFAASLTTVACGGDDSDSRPDATIFLDAPGGGPLAGLGESCTAATPQCPAAAPLCITNGRPTGYCSALCGGTTITMNGVGSGTFMTNNAPLPDVDQTTVMPPTAQWANAPCAAIYTSSAGLGECFQVINRMPTGPFTPNTAYTFAVACGIGCSAGQCPTGFTCDTNNGANVCRRD